MGLTDFFQAFKAGHELANATAWKNAQVVTNGVSVILMVLVAAVSAISRLVGHPVQIALDSAGAQAIGAGVFAAVGMFNGVATVVSSSKVGLRSLPDRGNDAGRTAAVPEQPPPRPIDADVFNTGNRG